MDCIYNVKFEKLKQTQKIQNQLSPKQFCREYFYSLDSNIVRVARCVLCAELRGRNVIIWERHGPAT